MDNKIRIKSEEVLSDNWYVLKKIKFDFQHSDGTWQTHEREAYDRGNGSTILLYNHERGTVVLTPAIPATYLYKRQRNGNDDRSLRRIARKR